MQKLGNVLPLISTHSANQITTQFSKPLDLQTWLAKWAAVPFHDRSKIPATMQEALKEEAEAARASLKPADPKAFAVGVAKLLAFCRAFGMQVETQALTAIYRDSVSHLPSDLWLEAVARATRAWKWQNPPKPFDLIAAVESDMKQRRKRLHLAQTAMLALE